MEFELEDDGRRPGKNPRRDGKQNVGARRDRRRQAGLDERL